MSILNKMVLLFTLLNNRSLVSMKDIQAVCGVSQRTAYRYINALSEVDISVYFDRKRRGYCLSRRKNGALHVQRISRNILMALGLKILSPRVNAVYKREIDDLLAHLCATQPFDPEALPQLFGNVISNINDTQDCSELIHVVMINAAIRCGKSIRLSMASRKKHESMKTVRQPRWHFDKQWYVASGHGSRSKIVRLLDIESVTLL